MGRAESDGARAVETTGHEYATLVAASEMPVRARGVSSRDADGIVLRTPLGYQLLTGAALFTFARAPN